MNKMDGSMTIEAAFIVPLLLVFVAAFIMGAIYLHDQIIFQVMQNQFEESCYLDGKSSVTKENTSSGNMIKEIQLEKNLNEQLWMKHEYARINTDFLSKSPITTMQNILVGWDVAGRMPILATAKLKIQNIVSNWQEQIKKLLESR